MAAAYRSPAVDEAFERLDRYGTAPFPARMRALAVLGRELTAETFAGLHALLDAGNDDDRHTGLFLAVARRDVDRLVAALADPLLRSRALAAAGRLPVPDEVLAGLALDATLAVRRNTYGILRRSRRWALADRLLPEVARRFGDLDIAALLPACSPDLVARWLPRLSPPPGLLRRLARTAPLAVAEAVATGQAGDALWPRTQVVRVLARRSPEAILLLLERAPRKLIEQATTTLLARPRAVLEIVRRDRLTGLFLRSQRLPRSVERAVRRLDPAEIAELAAAFFVQPDDWMGEGRSDGIHPLLALLPPSERRRIVAASVAPTTGVYEVPTAEIGTLDPADRAELLRPILARQRREAPPTELLRLLRLMPLPDVEEELLVQAGAAGHGVRMVAWPALLDCAQWHGDPEAYVRILDRAERAWHDQEEVRTVALRRAARTPSSLLAAVPLPVLRAATVAVVQSADSTPDTVAALTCWLVRVVERAAAEGEFSRAADALTLLLQAGADDRQEGTAPLRLTAGAAVAISALVRPERGRPATVLAAGRLLGRHLPALPELDAALGALWRSAGQAVAPTGGSARSRSAAAFRSDQEPTAATAARLWLGTGPDRDGRVGVVAAEGAQPALLVCAPLVATRRTDLVDLLLDRITTPVPGHGWLPGVPTAASRRWRPAQARRWQLLLAGIADDEDAALPIRVAATERITEPSTLLRLCRSELHPVAAAALTGLGRGADPGSALPELLAAAPLAGVRGRAAMTGVRRMVTRLPESAALEVCRRVVLDERASVGSRKGAVRAVAQIPSTGVRDLLLAVWDQPNLHRDVRAATAGELLRWIGDPEVPTRLAAFLTEPAVRDVVLDARPDVVGGPARGAYADFLAAAIRHHDPAVVRPALTGYGKWLPHGTAGSAPLVALLTDPATLDDVWDDGCLLLARRVTEPPMAGAWTAVVRGLSGPTTEPGRRRLAGLVRSWSWLPPDHLDVLVDPLVQARLPRAAARCACYAAMRALAHGNADPDRWARYLGTVDERATRIVTPSWYSPEEPVPTEQALALVRWLENAGGTVAIRLAVDLVELVGAQNRWAEPWRQIVLGWRESEDPDLAEPAWLTALPPR
ncbi:hypothetical protein [Plantactinospora soyae]|uniref:HEAT repeat domain-containing protein n=1 Tax=Plantactinospora soyae TaxID=1544732 RepID=A0A927M8H7_9ACTN|nr:hypothetical protein [Plantactinospora soyae]MBE1488541.1 hypothetical protein [Plantactinospora soyae]